MSSALRPVVVLGAGGHAAVLIDALERAGRPVLAALDRDVGGGAGRVLGVAIVDERLAPDRFPAAQVELAMAAVGFGEGVRRHDMATHWRNLGYRFATVVHPAAVVSAHAELAEGSQVLAGAVVQARSVVGRDAIVNSRAVVEHDCRIGEGGHLAPGVCLGGAVTIGARSQLGLGAVVLEGLTVGADSIVAAGAVVTRNVLAGVLVAGVPAAELRRLAC